jgi:hypothetical protein
MSLYICQYLKKFQSSSWLSWKFFIILTVIISKDGTLTRGLSSTGLLRMTTDLGYSTDLGFFGDFLGLM